MIHFPVVNFEVMAREKTLCGRDKLKITILDAKRGSLRDLLRKYLKWKGKELGMSEQGVMESRATHL